MAPYGQVIIIKKTGEDGSSFPLLTNTCKIGRGHVCDIRIQREAVSEEHCIIEARTDTQVWTRNLTNNTTLLNGVPLSKDWVALKHKDVIIISDRSFRWEYLPKSKFYSDVGAPCQQNTKTPYKVVEDKRKTIMQNSPMKRKGKPKSNVEAKLPSSSSNLDGIMSSNMTPLCNEKLEPAHFIGKDNIQLSNTPVMSELENICEQRSRKRKLSTVTPKPSLINRLAVTRVVKTPMSHGKISSTPKSVIKLKKRYSLITPERAASSGEIIKKKVQHTEMPNTEGKENLNSQGKASLSNKNTEGDTLSLSDCLKENHLVTTPVTTQKKPTADFSLNFESRRSLKTSACEQVLILDEISDSPEDKVLEKISDKKKKYRKSLRTPKGIDSFELVGGFHEKEKCNEEQFYSPLCADVTVLEPKLKANVDNELSDIHSKEYLRKTPKSNAVIELIQRRSMRTPRMRVSSGVSPFKCDTSTFKCDTSILSHEESVNSHKSMSVLKEDLINLTGATPETSCITTKLAITPKSVMKLKLRNSTKSVKKVGFPLSDIEKFQKENVKNQSNIIFSETNISASKRSALQVEGSMKNEVDNGKKEKQAYECISDVTHSSACKGRSFRKRLLTPSTEKDEIKSIPIELSCTDSITQNKPVDGGWSVTEIFNKTPENLEEINANNNFVQVVTHIKETPVGVRSVEEPLNPIQGPKTYKSESFDKPQSSSDIQLSEDEKSHEIQFTPIADHMSKPKRQDEKLQRLIERQNKSLKAEEISQWAVREINTDKLNLNDSRNTLQKRRSVKEKLKIDTPVIKRSEKKILNGSLDEEDGVMDLMQTPQAANAILQNTEKSVDGQHNTKGSTMEPQQVSQSMLNVVGEQTEGTKDIQPSSSRDNEREVTSPISPIEKDEEVTDMCKKTPRNRQSVTEKSQFATPALTKSAKKKAIESSTYTDDIQELVQTPLSESSNPQESQLSAKSQRKSRGSSIVSTEGPPSMLIDAAESRDESTYTHLLSSSDEERHDDLMHLSASMNEEIESDLRKKTLRKRKSATEKSSFATPALTKSVKKKTIESPNYTEGIKNLMQTPISGNSNLSELQMSAKSQRKTRRSTIVSTAAPPSLLIDAVESREESTNPLLLSSSDEEGQDGWKQRSDYINEEIVCDLSKKTPRNRKSVTEKSPFATPALTKSVKKKGIESPNYTEGIHNLMQTPLPTYVQFLSSGDEERLDELLQHSACINEEIVSDLGRKTPRNRKSVAEKSPFATPALTKSVKKKAIESPNYTEGIHDLMQTPLSENSNLQEFQSQRKTRRSTIVSTEGSPSLLIDVAESSEKSTHPHLASSSDEEGEDGWKQHSDYINEEIVSDLSKKTPRNRKSVTENSPFATPALTKSVKKKAIQSPNYTEGIKNSMLTPISGNSNLPELQMSAKSLRKTRRSTIVPTEGSPSLVIDVAESSEESTNPLLSSGDEERLDELLQHSACINEEIVSDLGRKTPRNRKSVAEKSPFATPALTKSVKKKAIESPNYTEGIHDLMQTPLSENSNLQEFQSQRKTRRSTIVSTEGSPSLLIDVAESSEKSTHPHLASSSDEEGQDGWKQHSDYINEEIVCDLSKKTPRNRKSVTEKSPFATPALTKSVKKKGIESPNYTEGIHDLMQTPLPTYVQFVSSGDEERLDELLQHSACINEEIVSDLGRKTPRNRKSVAEKSPFATPALTKSVKKKAIESPNYTEGIHDLIQTPLSENSNLQEFQSQRKTRRSTIVSTEGSSSLLIDVAESSEKSTHPHLASSSDEEGEDGWKQHSNYINEEIVSDLSKKTPRNRKSVTENSPLATPALTKSVKKKAIQSPNYTEGIKNLMQTPISGNSNLPELQMSAKSLRKTRRSTIVPTEGSPSLVIDVAESSEESTNPLLSSGDEERLDELLQHSACINEEIVSDLGRKTPRNMKSVTEKSPFASPALTNSVKKKAIESPNYTEGIHDLMQTPLSESSNLQELQSQRKTRRSTIVSTEGSPSLLIDVAESSEKSTHPHLASSSDEEGQDGWKQHSDYINEEIVCDLSKKTPRNRKSVTEKSPFATPAFTKSVKKKAIQSPNYTEGIKNSMLTPISGISNLQESQISAKSHHKTRRSSIVSTDESPSQLTDATECSDKSTHPLLLSSSDEDRQDDLMHHSASINEEIVSDLIKETPNNRKSVTEKSSFATPALTKSFKKKAIDSPNYTECIQDLMQTPLSGNSNLPESLMSAKNQRKIRRATIVSTDGSLSLQIDAALSVEESTQLQFLSSDDEENVSDLSKKTLRNRKLVTEKSLFATPAVKKSVNKKAIESPNCTGDIQDLLQTPLSENSNLQESQLSARGQRKTTSTIVSADGTLSLRIDAALGIEQSTRMHLLSSSDDERQNELMLHSSSLSEENVIDMNKITLRNRKSVTELSPFAGDESLSQSPRVNKEGVSDLRGKFSSDVVDILSSCNSEKGVNLVQSNPSIGPVNISTSASPEEYVSNVVSSKNISQNVHKKAGNSPISTYEDISGLKELMTRKSPESRYSDFRGVREIFSARSPKCNYLNVSGMKDLFNLSSTSVSKDACLGEKDNCHKGLRRSKTDTDDSCSVVSLGAGISVQELLNGPCPVVLLSKLDCESLQLSPKGTEKQIHNKSRCLRTRLGNHKDADSIVQDGDNKKHQQCLLQLNESNCNEAQIAKDMIQTEEQKLAPRTMRATRRNKGDTTQSSNSQGPPPMHNAEINEKKNLKSHASKSARSKSEVRDKDFDGAVLVASAEIKPSSSKMVKGQDGNASVITADMKSMPVESSLVAKEDEEVEDQISSAIQKRSLRKALTSDPDFDDSNKKDTKKRKRHNVTSYESVTEGISISQNVTSDLNSNPRRKTRSTKKDNLETPSIEKVLIEESKGVFATRISIRKKIASSQGLKESTLSEENISDKDKTSASNLNDDSAPAAASKSDLRSKEVKKKGRKPVHFKEPEVEEMEAKNDAVATDRRCLRRKTLADQGLKESTLSEENISDKDKTGASNLNDDLAPAAASKSDLRSKEVKKKGRKPVHFKEPEVEEMEAKNDAVATDRRCLRRKTLADQGLKESTLSKENISDKDKTGASNLNDDLAPAAASKSDLRSKEVKKKGRKPVHFKEPEVEEMEAKNDAVTTDRRCLRRKTLAEKDLLSEEKIADEDKTGASNLENLNDDLATTSASKSDLRSKVVKRKGRKPVHFKEPEVEKMEAKNDAVVTDRRCLRRKTLTSDDVADEKDKSVAKKRKTSNSLDEGTDKSLSGTLIHTDGAHLSNVKRVGSSRVLKSKSNKTDFIVNEEIQDSSNTERCSLRKKTLSSDDSESIRPKRGSKTKIPDADKENGF